jgi:hypothetical protein
MVGEVVSITRDLLLPRLPALAGVGNVNAALFPAVSLIEDPSVRDVDAT